MNQLELFGLVILEPVASLTDVITGLTALMVFRWMRQQDVSGQGYKNFKEFFLFLGLATVSGGILGHGLLHYLHFNWKMVGWILGSIALFQIERGSIKLFESELRKDVSRWLMRLVNLQLAVFIILMINPSTRIFKVVQMNSLFTYVIFLLPLFFIALVKWKHQKSMYLILSIIWLAFVGFIYNNQIGLHQWFNHHVLTHVLMTVYVLLVFTAVRSFYPELQNEGVDLPANSKERFLD